MRLPEQKLYDWLRRRVGAFTMLERIENRVKTSTPDLYACSTELECWIELKVLPAFPAKPTTRVRIEHWTSGQRFWAMRHRAHGGTTILLLQVEDLVFAVDAGMVALESDKWTREDWMRQPHTTMRNATAQQVLDTLLRAVVQ